jgi:hypothetical protein
MHFEITDGSIVIQVKIDERRAAQIRAVID